MISGLLVTDGSRLLAGFSEGASLAAHLQRHGPLPRVSAESLEAIADRAQLRGRGGAGFPFAVKLRAAVDSGRRRVVVVNWSEGEPASWKDAALAAGRPHLVLDGAIAAATALGVREVHLVLPRENELVQSYVADAVAERTERIDFRIHLAEDRFVAGQARAVLELMAGRPNLPVTAWAPEAISGLRGRPTLISNAETWATLALLVRGDRSPETVLLTLDGESETPRVIEVEMGTPWNVVVEPAPYLIGGYHGSWVTPEWLETARVDRKTGPLGAGAVIPLGPEEDPVRMSARVVRYLAGESAGRCGPCVNGLPALADAMAGLVAGADTTARLLELAGLVERRGACAHPDGTARLVRSLLLSYPELVAGYARGGRRPPPPAPPTSATTTTTLTQVPV